MTNRYVDIVFDCLPLRSIGRMDIPLDASPKYRARCERIKHALAVHGELFLEIVRRSEPQTPRADLELDRGIGHAMCLNLVNKLKAVLDRAQKDVRMRQLVPHRLADQAGPGERIERGQRAGLPKRRVAAAVRQLKHLREELDFPDYAVASEALMASGSRRAPSS